MPPVREKRQTQKPTGVGAGLTDSAVWRKYGSHSNRLLSDSEHRADSARGSQFDCLRFLDHLPDAIHSRDALLEVVRHDSAQRLAYHAQFIGHGAGSGKGMGHLGGTCNATTIAVAIMGVSLRRLNVTGFAISAGAGLASPSRLPAVTACALRSSKVPRRLACPISFRP